MDPFSPSKEDYIKHIYLLIKQKGFARVSDIAELFDVYPASVTKMIQILHKEGYLNYERYRGISLNSKGNELGEYYATRHDSIEKFLTTIGVQSENILQNADGIEHFVDTDALNLIEAVTKFFANHPDSLEILKRM